MSNEFKLTEYEYKKLVERIDKIAGINSKLNSYEKKLEDVFAEFLVITNELKAINKRIDRIKTKMFKVKERGEVDGIHDTDKEPIKAA
jgi:predicted  nucleic acid-binding Zn-ribbon protein